MPPDGLLTSRAAVSRRSTLPPPASRADLATRRKAELHLHLRGAAPLRYLRQQVRKYPPAAAVASAPPRQLEWMRRNPSVRRILQADDPLSEIDRVFRFATFEEFLAAYLFTGYLVKDIEDFRDLVAAVRQGLREQNIAYAEITVSLLEYTQQGIALDELLAALGENPAEEPLVRWIVDPVRSFGPAAARESVAAAPARTSAVGRRPDSGRGGASASFRAFSARLPDRTRGRPADDDPRRGGAGTRERLGRAADSKRRAGGPRRPRRRGPRAGTVSRRTRHSAGSLPD